MKTRHSIKAGLVVAGLALVPAGALAQSYGSIPRDRIPPAGWEDTQWVDPGGWQRLDVSQFGLRPNEPSVDAAVALKNIVEKSTSGRRILYFPPGLYYFKTNLRLDVSDLILQGAGSGTVFRITSPGDDLAQIEIGFDRAKQLGPALSLTANMAAGADTVTVSDASSLAVGHFLLLSKPPSVWEGPTHSQIVRIKAKSGNTLTLDMKAGLSYPLSETPSVRRINLLQNVGIEKLKVERTNGWTSDRYNIQNAGNLVLTGVYNGFLRDIESEYSIRNHLQVDWSRNVVVERNLLYETREKQTGGWGYGVGTNWATRVRITDNKTWELRHQIILQAGSNHCVVSYNSIESPTDYNDLALHATYAYMNLFEGNRFTDSFADNSKEEDPNKTDTGPGNTWFRNYASGMVGSMNNATYRQNIIGNVVNELLDAHDYTKFQHYFGANRVKGTDNWRELSSTATIPASLYLTQKPALLGSKSWPLFGPGVGSNWGTSNTLPAADRPRPTLFTVDALNDWSQTDSHSANLIFDTANPELLGNDGSRATRIASTANTPAEIVWKRPGITAFRAVAYHWPDEATTHLGFLTSMDGTTWTPVTATVEAEDGNWKRVVYSAKNLGGANFLKARFNATSGKGWAQQLSQVQISHGYAHIDQADGWTLSERHSPDMTIDSSNSEKFADDGARFRRTTAENQSIQWRKEGMSLFNISAFYWPDEPVSHFRFDVSKDGQTWTTVTPKIAGGATPTGGDWQRYWYTLPDLEGMNYVKVTWTNLNGKAFSPQIGNVVVR
jgi:hypothetical protein